MLPRLIITVLVLLLLTPLQSRGDTLTIPDSEAAQHIGQKANVEGVVILVSTSKKGNAFINFGGVYPNQTFTGWIPAGTDLSSDPSILTPVPGAPDLNYRRNNASP